MLTHYKYYSILHSSKRNNNLTRERYMKALLLTVLLATSATSVSASEFNLDAFLNKTYVTIGAGYKFKESQFKYKENGQTVRFNDPLSARFEIGYQYNKHIKFGVSHDSQWRTGFPFNNKKEPSKTEVFIDYTFTLGDLL